MDGPRRGRVCAAGVTLCWAQPSPIGSNVVRLALLAGAAILLCAAALAHVVWSPWLAIGGVDDDTTPRACLTRSGEWTELVAPAAGTYTITTRYTFDRGTPCPPADQASAVQIRAPRPAATQ